MLCIFVRVCHCRLSHVLCTHQASLSIIIMEPGIFFRFRRWTNLQFRPKTRPYCSALAGFGELRLWRTREWALLTTNYSPSSLLLLLFTFFLAIYRPFRFWNKWMYKRTNLGACMCINCATKQGINHAEYGLPRKYTIYTRIYKYIKQVEVCRAATFSVWKTTSSWFWFFMVGA